MWNRRMLSRGGTLFFGWVALSGLSGALAGCAKEALPADDPITKEMTAKEKIPKKTTTQKTGSAMNQHTTPPPSVPPGRAVATLAGGCFWCTEAVFVELKGVERVVSGYSGGETPNPTYAQVCDGTTGHAEAIQITFDPKTISFKEILEIFFTTHDPTTPNQQGADMGTQYRSAVFYHDAAQQKTAQEIIQAFEAKRVWPAPIVTEVTPFTNFYSAEDYHQDYFARNGGKPYCQIVIAPKVAKLRAQFREKLKR